MNLDRLRYFCVIAETGSLRRAAEILRLSPAALSKALHVLEKEVGCPLTLPAGRGLAPALLKRATSVAPIEPIWVSVKAPACVSVNAENCVAARALSCDELSSEIRVVVKPATAVVDSAPICVGFRTANCVEVRA